MMMMVVVVVVVVVICFANDTKPYCLWESHYTIATFSYKN